ncbi:MAG: hypothetical protein GF329_21695 [Candidatus Lokiarchaeota archaeon]|nr:hypothetical protein [Candidatus Lokiarchaeota archaeon]
MDSKKIMKLFTKIDGINNQIAKLLVKAGIYSLDQLINTPTSNIKEMTGSSENEIIDWIYRARKLKRSRQKKVVKEEKVEEKEGIFVKKCEVPTPKGGAVGIIIGKRSAFYSIYKSGSTILSILIMIIGTVLFSLSFTITNYDQLIELYESIPFIYQSISLTSSISFYWGIFIVFVSVIIGGWLLISFFISMIKDVSFQKVARTLGFCGTPALFFVIFIIVKFINSSYLLYSFKTALLPLGIFFLSIWALLIVIRAFQSLSMLLDKYTYVGFE